jgi:Protein of unknown function (DUF3568)
MNIFRMLGVIMFLSISVLSSSGCFAVLVGAAAGAGGVAYVKGELTKNVDEPLDRCYKAALAAMKDLKMDVIEEKTGDHLRIVVGRFSDGKKGKVTLEKLTEKSTQVRIRSGVFGDQTKSTMILNALEKRL